ncbi:MAG: alanine racemase [Acetobacteraceae bacterium]|nr:alanine racemase [Acetobacteraceae bacterium]
MAEPRPVAGGGRGEPAGPGEAACTFPAPPGLEAALEGHRPTWAEVDLDAVAHNVAAIRRHIGPHSALMAVVKADAYGHGAVEVGRACLEAGAKWLAVATPEEGVELRRAGISAPILVMCLAHPSQAAAVVEHRLSQTVCNWELAQALDGAARARGVQAAVHLKIDTGLTRLGLVSPRDAVEFARGLQGLPGLRLEGTYTHMADADAEDKSFTRLQFERFMEVRSAMVQAGVDPGLLHAANTATAVDLPELSLDAVRVGLGIYGLVPGRAQRGRLDLRPVMAWKTRILFLREVPGGTPVSYGRTYVTPAPRVVATVPVGYADGINRLLSNRVSWLVRGKPAPLLGRVCMDQCMLDVTGIPGVAVGDEAVIMGRQGPSQLTADDIADLLGTITYEVLCWVGRRVVRVYLRKGCIVKSRGPLSHAACPGPL